MPKGGIGRGAWLAGWVGALALGGETVRTNTFEVIGSKIQEGKWQKRIASLPEGATVTIRAEARPGLQKDAEGARLGVRLRACDPEYWCDARGRWSGECFWSVFRAPEVSLKVPPGGALYVTCSPNARFRLTVVTRSETAAEPAEVPTGRAEVTTGDQEATPKEPAPGPGEPRPEVNASPGR